MGISFGVGLLSGVIESSMLVTSATSGPLLGVFVLAMLIPCCNWKVRARRVKYVVNDELRRVLKCSFLKFGGKLMEGVATGG